MSVDRLNPADVRGRRVFWLIDLEWGGQVIRLSTHELDIEAANTGEVLHYSAALDEVRLAEGLGELTQESSVQSLPVEAILPVDVPALVAQGHDLAAARATVARWLEGTDYEQRRLVLVGGLSDPEWGAADEPVAFSIENNIWQDRALVPGATQRVDGNTWPQEILSLNTEHLGLDYPIVFGHPGVVDPALDSSGWVTGTIALWAMHQPVDRGAATQWSGLILVIAGHHVSAQRVYINTDSDTAGDRVLVQNGYDQRGNPVAFIPWYYSKSGTSEPYDFDAVASYVWANPSDFDSQRTDGLGSGAIADPYLDSTQPLVFVGWRDDEDPSRGGVQLNGRTVREAGDVLEYLASLTTLPVDRGRFAAMKPLLSRFKLDGVIEARCSPWEFLKASILPLLPVTLSSGPEGVYPVVWRYEATAEDAVVQIDADRNADIERVGRIKQDTTKIVNDFTLKFAYSRRTKSHVGVVRLGAYAEPGTDEAAPIIPSLFCRRSQERMKGIDGRALVSSRQVETRMIYDLATARAICAWWAACYALPVVTVSYLVPEEEFIHLEPGMVVSITDSGVALSNRVALVKEVQTEGNGMLGVVLRILEDPARDLRR